MWIHIGDLSCADLNPSGMQTTTLGEKIDLNLDLTSRLFAHNSNIFKVNSRINNIVVVTSRVCVVEVSLGRDRAPVGDRLKIKNEFQKILNTVQPDVIIISALELAPSTFADKAEAGCAIRLLFARFSASRNFL